MLLFRSEYEYFKKYKLVNIIDSKTYLHEEGMYVEKDFVWSYIDDTLTIYDMNFNKLYDVSVSNVGDVEKHGTYLVVDYYKDTETSVESQMYIDYSTGEVKDNIEDIKVNYG